MNDVDNTSNENVYSTLEVAPINSTELDGVTEASNTQTEKSLNTVDGFDEVLLIYEVSMPVCTLAPTPEYLLYLYVLFCVFEQDRRWN